MQKLIVEPSPHIRKNITTRKIMLDVIIALAPALVVSAFLFGLWAITLVAVCVISCVVFEFLVRIVMKKEQTVGDLSAVVTGLLLAFNLPPTLPLYIAVIGSFIAIVIVKELFGGIGQNFANPAITARIVLALSFTSQMTKWVEPFFFRSGTSHIDAVATASPLAVDASAAEFPSMMQLFLGNHSGCIGETSAVALIIGGIYLVCRRVISPITPLAFIGTVAGLALITGDNAINQVLMGGLLIGAIFMATDYATTPLNPIGKLIFGIGCGVITYAIRALGSAPEGVSFSILFMNILTPHIDRLTRTRPFGMVKSQS